MTKMNADQSAARGGCTLMFTTYACFPNLEKNPYLIDIENNEEIEDISSITTNQRDIGDSLDESTSENEHLPEPLAPEILQQQQTKHDNS